MASLKFTENELDEMREFYREGLERTHKSLEHIKTILNKLGGNELPSKLQVIQDRSITDKIEKAPSRLSSMLFPTCTAQG